jgi:hypothetical protein
MQWFVRWHSYCVFRERCSETIPVLSKQGFDNLTLAEIAYRCDVFFGQRTSLRLTSSEYPREQD